MKNLSALYVYHSLMQELQRLKLPEKEKEFENGNFVLYML